MDKANEEPPGGATGDRLREVGRYRRVAKAHEHGLVVLAMGIPYWLMPLAEEGYGLYVEAEHEAAVREQFEKFDRENRYWPPPQDLLPDSPGGGSLALYAILIWSVFLVRKPDLLAAGSASEKAIAAGEWWRGITALTLHADWAHLAGNTLGGWLFFSLVLRYLGTGLGWLSILVAGGLGNLINAWAYGGSGHDSIGASTAVFGGLGLVIGFRLVREFRLTGWHWPRNLWVPLLAGLALLGFLGAGGERTDVLAHGWGFAVGLVLGVCVGIGGLDVRLQGKGIQRCLAWTTPLAVLTAWLAALVRV